MLTKPHNGVGKLIDNWIIEDSNDAFFTADWGKSCDIKTPQFVNPLTVNLEDTDAVEWLDSISDRVSLTTIGAGYKKMYIIFRDKDEETEYKLRFLYNLS